MTTRIAVVTGARWAACAAISSGSYTGEYGGA